MLNKESVCTIAHIALGFYTIRLPLGGRYGVADRTEGTTVPGMGRSAFVGLSFSF